MIQCKCIQKFRDNNGRIYGYRLQDINGQIQDVTPNDLKNVIAHKQLEVVNLNLTSDGRLIDKKVEKQLQNTELMPNKVEKSQNSNDKLFSILEKCANKIALAVTGKGITMCIDRDTSVKNRVSAQFELEKGIVYKGTERQLDLMLSLEGKDKCMWIGLLSTEDFNTEADKSFKIKDKFNLDIIMGFVDEYIKYLKNLNNTKYKVMFTSLALIDELDEDIEKLIEEYDSDVKIVKIPNNVSVDDFIDDYGIDDYLYPYMSTDDDNSIIRDWENTIAITFIKNGYTEKIIFYSSDKDNSLLILDKELNISINKNKCKQCKYCENIIGFDNSEYLGYSNIKYNMSKLKEIENTLYNIIVIRVGVQ